MAGVGENQSPGNYPGMAMSYYGYVGGSSDLFNREFAWGLFKTYGGEQEGGRQNDHDGIDNDALINLINYDPEELSIVDLRKNYVPPPSLAPESMAVSSPSLNDLTLSRSEESYHMDMERNERSLDLRLDVDVNHTMTTGNSCNVCKKTYVKKSMLEKHLLLDRCVDAVLKKFRKCKICSELFDSLDMLRDHYFSHGIAVKCRSCCRSFNSIAELNQHEAIHLRTCRFCYKVVLNNSNLKIHERIHTRERPYKCEDCGKAYTQWCNLEYHLKKNPGHRKSVEVKNDVEVNMTLM